MHCNEYTIYAYYFFPFYVINQKSKKKTNKKTTFDFEKNLFFFTSGAGSLSVFEVGIGFRYFFGFSQVGFGFRFSKYRDIGSVFRFLIMIMLTIQ